MTKTETYRTFLQEQGFTPASPEAGILAFRYEGGNYLLFPEEDDAQYFHLMFPGFWAIDSDDERGRALAAASEATAGLKAAKVFVLGNQAHASLELFLPKVDDFKGLFKRALRVLQEAVDRFRKQMVTPFSIGGLLDAARRAAEGEGPAGFERGGRPELN